MLYWRGCHHQRCCHGLLHLLQGFEIYTNKSKFQHEAAITKNNMPMACFGQKPNMVKVAFNLTTQSLLVIMERLKEIKVMFMVFTNLKDLTQDSLMWFALTECTTRN